VCQAIGASVKPAKEKIIDFLLSHAGPSIVLRVKKEILSCLSSAEENDLLDRILQEKNVQTVIQSQKPDGWFGNYFHGQSGKFGAGMFDNMEVGLRYLAEKGFPPDNERVAKAVNSFLAKEPYDYAAYRIKQPEAPDTDYTYTAYGLYLMRSSVIIRAGHECRLPKNAFIDLKRDIDFSLKTFANALNYAGANDAIDERGKKLCFKPGTRWACMYDLRMLAHSQGWRSEKNISLLAGSVSRLFSFPQSGEDVYTYRKGQFISPAWAFIHKPILGSIKDKAVGSTWLDLMELFARCGIVNQVSALKSEYESLLALIDGGCNLGANFSAKRSEINWSPYYGIAIEEDWKTVKKKRCDILFRVLLIIHYAERHS